MQFLVENYEMIRRVKLDLKPGTLTLISGVNGHGKSAFVRALESFVKNKTGDEFIRAGTTATKVGIKTDENRTFLWKRTAKGAIYKIGSREEKSLNRKALPEIDPSSGFLVEKDLAKVLVPNLVHEKTRVFPFNLTSSMIFKIFNRFMGMPQLEKMMKEVKLQVKEDTKTLHTVKGNVEAYDDEVMKLRTELARMPDEKVLRTLRSEIVDLELEIEHLVLICDQQKSLIKKYRILRKEGEELQIILAQLEGIDQWSVELNELSRLVRVGGVVNVNISGFKTYKGELEELKAKLNVVKGLDLEKLGVNQLEKWSALLKQVDEKKKALDSSVGEVRNLKGLSAIDLESISQDLKFVQKGDMIRQKHNEYDGLKLQEETLSQEIGILEEERLKYKTCPLCGSKI